MTNQKVDVIIIGSGISSLIVADKLSDHKNVIIITKSKKENSNSIWAQGGVAAAVARSDHWMNHFIDTVTAGNDHNIEEAVKLLVQKGPKMINNLIDKGMIFDSDLNGKLHLGKEGAHGKRRILHSGGDATGRGLMEFLFERVKSKVKIIENKMAVDLLVQGKHCYGVKVKSLSGEISNIFANHTVLASGGYGGLYSFTSNDPSITGDGLAMAYRAGADLGDLEFVQFHPTMLNVNGKAKGLISEAVRGEGAILVTENGLLMDGIHEQADLAPRDIVSRQIHHAVSQGKNVYLNISMVDNFKVRFPTITKICQNNGVDLSNGLIPVVPGAHFSMGGIMTDQKGLTSISSLYAVGEVACTGVHGANRLASNSLLEGIVYGNELADHLLNSSPYQISEYVEKECNNSEVTTLPSQKDIKKVMMNFVGIVRNEEGLENAKEWFERYLKNHIDVSFKTLNSRQIETINMLTTGWLITTSALMRTESRGGHYRSDYHLENDKGWHKKIIIRNSHSHVLSPIL